jgi:septal ring factor EnvC (AmiA/AmiB activator)
MGGDNHMITPEPVSIIAVSQQIAVLSSSYEAMQKSVGRVENDLQEIKMTLGVMASHQVEAQITDIASAIKDIRNALRDFKDTETRSLASEASIKDIIHRLAILEADKTRREGATTLVRVIWTVIGGGGAVTAIAAAFAYIKGQ